MAKGKELSKLVPKSVEIEDRDGAKVLVPGDKEENSILNKIMASKIRGLLEATIKKYEDRDSTLSPKDLKDLAEAGRNISEFSGKVYEETELSIKVEAKQAEQVIEVQDFGALNKNKNGDSGVQEAKAD